MSHLIQQIREAVATAVTGLTTTGSRVYQSRLYPRALPAGPCLVVSTDSESASQLTVHPTPRLQRSLTVTIRAYALANDNLDDVLDTVQSEVEVALGNTTLSGKVQTLTYTGRSLLLDEATDQPVGVLTLTYEAVYVTASNAPTTTA
jgi:hypothetical protein